MKPQKLFTILLFSAYMLLLIAVIIFKLPFYSPQLSDGVRVMNFIPFQGSYDDNGTLILREIIYNIVIFVPLGIYICMLKNEWSFIKKAMLIMGLSLSFEIMQFIFAIGRSDITDVLSNTIGGVIGISFYGLSNKILGAQTGKIVNAFAFILTVLAMMRFFHLFYLSHFSMMSPPL